MPVNFIAPNATVAVTPSAMTNKETSAFVRTLRLSMLI